MGAWRHGSAGALTATLGADVSPARSTRSTFSSTPASVARSTPKEMAAHRGGAVRAVHARAGRGWRLVEGGRWDWLATPSRQTTHSHSAFSPKLGAERARRTVHARVCDGCRSFKPRRWISSSISAPFRFPSRRSV